VVDVLIVTAQHQTQWGCCLARRGPPWADGQPSSRVGSSPPARDRAYRLSLRVPYQPARHRALQQHITVTIPTLSGPVLDHPATQRMLAGAFADAANSRQQEVTATQ
jgi:hypothetical protein